jgi:hypothetical protein
MATVGFFSIAVSHCEKIIFARYMQENSKSIYIDLCYKNTLIKPLARGGNQQ